ncbi:hypothetical protein NEIPOLOT_01173 [Neisseria polysaccharea ATCC 43768]|nr:hypothetical protein NEIPOLOT_01173 [Neisseria polysaccharea ATCC 43768]
MRKIYFLKISKRKDIKKSKMPSEKKTVATTDKPLIKNQGT